MTVKTKSYNADTAGYDNVELTEPDWIDFRIIARFNEPAEATITIADPTGSKMQKYGVFPVKDLAGAVADDGGVETDESTEASEDTLDDMTLFPVVPAVNDAYYFAFDDPVGSMILVISTAFVGDLSEQVLIWEYSKGSDSWDTLLVPALSTMDEWVVGKHTPTWTPPGDWATDEVGSISDKYWIRARLIVFPGGIWTTSPLGKRVWTSEVYVGPGRVTIDSIYDGRILKTSFDQAGKTVSLHCKDWMSQLDDAVITKDMREDLDGNGLREGQAHSDPDHPLFVGVAEEALGRYFFYDDGEYDDDGGMGWANDQFNGLKLVLAATMEGKKTWRFYPYQGSTTDNDNTIAMDNGIEDVWLKNGDKHFCTDVGDYVTVYDFRVELGHPTPSDFYVHDSISAFRIGVHTKLGDTGGNHCHIEVKNTGGGQIIMGQLSSVEDEYKTYIFEMETKTLLDDIVAADGELELTFNCDRGGGGNLELYIDTVWVEVVVETTGYDSVISIVDTTAPNKLEVGTDITAAATQIWEMINYCIVREVYKHIASDETPGDLITDGSTGSGPDPLVVITAAGTVEHTTSFSTRRYESGTRLVIVKDLAEIDKVAFFMEIGTTVFTWKSTFNNGAPDALTDADVIRWTGERSFVDVRNNYILYGPKQNESLLRLDTADISPDPGADSKTTYGVTRSRTVNNKGVNNLYEITELGTALVERDEDALLFLSCEIAGLSSLRLGDEISITSTHMGLTAEVYVITEWEFGWRDNITKLRFHPRLSTKGFVPHRIFSNSIRRLGQDTERLDADVTYEAPEDSN